MKVTIEGKELVIRIPMQDPKPSASGKTLVVCTTNGNVDSGVQLGGKPLILGLTAYIRK